MPKPFDPAGLRFDATVATLDNGLRVLVHRDRRSPFVAVHIAYRAGSREEPPAKYGLAHLFEHLMFSGSEHSPENYFTPLEQIGALSINANADDDCAAYFQMVPAGALDYALWMEAERMGCLIGALNQAALDRQRAVVRNELLERQVAPYGRIPDLIRRHSYPHDHPYAHHPYGRIDDLDSITLDDAARWYESRYGAASAAIVIAGDVEPAAAIDLAHRRFEAIRPSLSHPAPISSIARPAAPQRMQVAERHAASRIYRVWNVPATGSAECASLELACESLAGGESSRLFRRMVREARIATGVAIELQKRELGSQVVLSATAAPDSTLAALDAALDRELSHFVNEPPSEEERASARARIVARFIRETEHLCGPRSRSDLLASAALAGEPPEAATAHLGAIAAHTGHAIAETAAHWLDGRHLTIEVSRSTPE